MLFSGPNMVGTDSAPLSSTLRLASLVPSLTELIVALGLGGRLVARTGFCVRPADALREVPKVGGTKDVNLAKLQALRPTHVLVNMDENRRETVEAIRAWPDPPELVVTHPLTPEDNLALIGQLATRFGAPESGAALAHELRAELARTCPDAWPARRVLYLIWRGPWMTVARDTYIAAMLARVNWQTWPDASGGPSGAARYPQVHGDEPWLGEIDHVLLSSEPYAFGASHVPEAQALCPNARVRLVDGELLSWYGARTAPGLRYLREVALAAIG